jgi:hypothetical protein
VLTLKYTIDPAAAPAQATSFQATTDAQGEYSFTQAPQGVYDLRVTAGGYRRATVTSVLILANNSAVINVALHPLQNVAATGSITGAVISQGGLQPIPGALALVLPVGSGGPVAQTRASGFVTANTNGQFSLINLQPGTYQLIVAADGYYTAVENSVQVQAGQSMTIEVTLVAVSGSATNGNGSAIGNGDGNGGNSAIGNGDHGGRHNHGAGGHIRIGNRRPRREG